MTQIQATYRPAYAIESAQGALMRAIYQWMAFGLLVTGLTAMYCIDSPDVIQRIVTQPGLFFGLAIAELALVVWLSAGINRMAATTAMGIFVAYSALNGVTIAPLLYMFTRESVTSTFLITAGLFGSMAAYGTMTKRDLTGMGSFLMMGLWGVILASLVNFFFHSSSVQFVTSVAAVIIFTGLTAYDTQKFRRIGAGVAAGSEEFRRIAVIGALSLYLDFINIFIRLLQFFGNRRD